MSTTLPSAATKVHMDSAADDPKQARTELATLVDVHNSLQSALGGAAQLAVQSTSGMETVAQAGGTPDDLQVKAFTGITVDANGVSLTENPLAQGLHTIWIPASAMLPNPTAGAAAVALFDNTSFEEVAYQYLAYTTAVDQSAVFQLRMPESWNGGTVTTQVIWTQVSRTTGDVIWEVQLVAVAPATSMNNLNYRIAGGSAQVTDGPPAASHQLAEAAISGSITPGGSATKRVVYGNVVRKGTLAGDTNANNADLLGMLILFTLNASTDV